MENIIRILETKIKEEMKVFKDLCAIPFKDDIWRHKLLKCKYRKHLLEELIEEYSAINDNKLIT